MSTSNLPPHAFTAIIAAADEAEAADAELKRRARELLLSNRHELLCQLLDRWYHGAPVEVLAWLKQHSPPEPSANPGGT